MKRKIIGILVFILMIGTSIVPVMGEVETKIEISKVNVEKLTSPNQPPEKPTIDNPPTAKVNEEYKFSVHSFDPNYDQIYFKINYWDGTITDWIGPFYYNATVEFTHVYTEQRSYQLSVKAKDDPNMDGDLSDGLESEQADSVVRVSKSNDKSSNDIIENSAPIKLIASDGAEYDSFGESVAMVGDYALIGPADDDFCFRTWANKGKSKSSIYIEGKWSNPLFQWFLENHPHMFPLLRQLFGL